MSDTLITIVAIFLAAILMFIWPLMAVSERNDDIAQTVVQTETTEFVTKIATKGKITVNDYEAFLNKLATTGNTYEVDIELQILDENFGKKSIITSPNAIGENSRYSIFTTDILDYIYSSSSDITRDFILSKGDNVIVTVKNTNTTMAQTLRAFFYKVTGSGTYQVAASSSSMVINSGK